MSRWRVARLAILPAFLAACAGGPPPPAWQAIAHGSLGEFSAAYLEGNARVAAVEFSRAQRELSRTGRADLIARGELTRCAVRVASLEFDDCAEAYAHGGDSGAAEQAYAVFLLGRWQELDAALLPPQYRALPRGDGGARRLGEIPDPLSRLIAAGALLRAGRLDPGGIELATETAAAQGWRRPLLAWLGVQRARAAEAGDKAASERLQRRIDLVTTARRRLD